MSVFVYDYDHNAPDASHLAATHYKGYKKIREKNPDIPVIMVTAPIDDTALLCGRYSDYRAIIMKSYLDARNSGDENVYFVDGASFYNGEFPNSCSVDGCHPTDLGFLRMASGIGRIVELVL